MKDRIFQLIEAKNMSVGTFADEIGIERSTMSHIKAERSKPSLDIAQKILARFPEVSIDWLILGKGAMFSGSSDSQELNLFDNFDSNTSFTESNSAKNTSKTTKAVETSPVKTIQPRSLTRVIVFYDDGTFDEIIKK